MEYRKHTIPSWLTANYETITTLILLAIFEALILTSGKQYQNGTANVAIIGGFLILFLKGIMGGAPAKTNASGIIALIFTAAAYFLTAYYAAALPGTTALLLATATLSLLLAAIAAAFTFRHFEEVVSLRIFFRNSPTSLFSHALAYYANRFLAILCNTSATILLTANTIQAIKHWQF